MSSLSYLGHMYYCRWLDDCDEAINLIVDSKVQEHTQRWSINVICNINPARWLAVALQKYLLFWF